MTTSYKNRYEKLVKANAELTRESKALVNHLFRIKKKCAENKLWLIASCDPFEPLEDVNQQGPMVTKLFDLAGRLKTKL